MVSSLLWKKSYIYCNNLFARWQARINEKAEVIEILNSRFLTDRVLTKIGRSPILIIVQHNTVME